MRRKAKSLDIQYVNLYDPFIVGTVFQTPSVLASLRNAPVGPAGWGKETSCPGAVGRA